MRRIVFAVTVSLLAAGCVAEGSTRMPLALHNATMTQMDATGSVVQKRKVVALACRKAGFARKSDPYYDCMRALIARDVQRMADRAETLLRHAANRHGVCVARPTYDVARCVEI
jgi:hypothetical protein